MKAKSQNVKIQFDSLQNLSVTISNNLWYFVITLRSHAKNLITIMNVWKLRHIMLLEKCDLSNILGC